MKFSITKIMTTTKNYPKIIRVYYYKEGETADRRKPAWYMTSDTVIDFKDESAFYESLNHEANLIIEID